MSQKEVAFLMGLLMGRKRSDTALESCSFAMIDDTNGFCHRQSEKVVCCRLSAAKEARLVELWREGRATGTGAR
jgi:hypothetical protein